MESPVGTDHCSAINQSINQYWMESPCRLGQRMRVASAGGNPGRVQTPSVPRKTAQEAFCSRELAPPPPQTNIWLPLACRHPQIERCDAVRRQHLQAGSLGRNAKYQRRSHSQCPAGCSVVPNSIHATSHLRCRLGSSILRLSAAGHWAIT